MERRKVGLVAVVGRDEFARSIHGEGHVHRRVWHEAPFCVPHVEVHEHEVGICLRVVLDLQL